MEKEEIKKHISKIIDTLPQANLLDTLNYLKELELPEHMKKILSEDYKLLKKLAE